MNEISNFSVHLRMTNPSCLIGKDYDQGLKRRIHRTPALHGIKETYRVLVNRGRAYVLM